MAKNKIPTATATNSLGFVHWNTPEEREIALSESAMSLEACDAIPRGKAIANVFQNFENIVPNTNIRNQFTRRDYEYFRPADSVACLPKSAILQCMDVYKRIGIIRNTIDLMSEFGTDGINIVHPIPKTQRFFRAWFNLINGPERSERFLNLLYRSANVFVNRSRGKISTEYTNKLSRAIGATEPIPTSVTAMEIPLGYTFINPAVIEVIGGELGNFIGQPQYAMRLSPQLKKDLLKPTNSAANLSGKVPDFVMDIIKRDKSRSPLIPLDMNDTTVWYYKKDDWETWASPLIYAIMEDIVAYRKMKLADLTALDGAISTVRLWKLGDIKNNIAPTKDAMVRLSTLLTNNVGGGALDIVWNEAIDFKESSSDVAKFLGQEKYIPTLNAIFAGLGIPPSLTGQGGKGSFEGNYITLKTMMERLEYGRQVLKNFWHQELDIVRRAMGIARPAEVTFDRMVLSDEAAEKALLIQLSDRNLISDESLLSHFGEVPHIEKQRIQNEHRSRIKGTKPPKAGQWYHPEKEFELKKLFASGGSVTPSELGIDLKEKKSGQVPALKMRQTKQDNRGVPQQGRPINSKDSKQRKNKRVLVKTKANHSLAVWAAETQKTIAEILNRETLNKLGKGNLRQLTKMEFDELELTKFRVLLSMQPMQNVSSSKIKALASKNFEIPETIINKIERVITKNPHITTDGLRQLHISLYVSANS